MDEIKQIIEAGMDRDAYGSTTREQQKDKADRNLSAFFFYDRKILIKDDDGV